MAEQTKSETPFFSEFTKIIFGILIGLASFQVLAPLIWNYLSDLLHLEKLTSFRWIVGVYFLMPALVVACWWHIYGHKNISRLFKNCSSTEPLSNHQKLLLKILSINFPALFIIYFLLILLPQIFDNKALYYSIQIISTLACALVLALCSRLTLEKLKRASILNQVKKEEKNYRLLIITFISLFLLFTGFELTYLSHIDKTKLVDRVAFDAVKIENKQVIQNAFRLNDLKDGVASTRKKFEDNEERLILSYKLSQLKKMQSDTVAIKASTTDLLNLIVPNKYYEEYLKHKRDSVADTLLTIQYLQMTKQIGALLKFVDLANDCTFYSASSFELVPPPYSIENVLNFKAYDNSKNYETSLMQKEYSWYETAIPVLKMIESKLNKLSKRQLTQILSNVQMKGIFLLSTLFILISALYMFLKINKDLLAKETGITDVANSNLNECIVHNEKLSNIVWIFLNVGIWLLIPLFKPVNEESVNIDKPLQMLTLAREYGNDVKEYNYDQSQKTFNDNSFSITLNKDEAFINPDTLRPKQIVIDDKKINEILNRVRKMNNEDDEAIILKNLYETIKLKKDPTVNNNTLKNPNKK